MDITATGNFRNAGETDNLDLTFDYQVAERISKEVFESSPKKLIETLCVKIGNRLFQSAPGISSLSVAVRKIDPPLLTQAEYAEISMTWHR